MTWYRVDFPDKGAGRTRIAAYVEADSPQDARRRAADHDHFGMYDTSKGDVWALPDDRDFDGPEDLVSGIGGPNTAITADGDRVTRGDV